MGLTVGDRSDPCCQILALMGLTVGDRADPCCQILALMGLTVGDQTCHAGGNCQLQPVTVGRPVLSNYCLYVEYGGRRLKR